MAAGPPRTLSVPEPQVLLDFFDDAAGFFWHHRILLSRGPGVAQWIVGTPDAEVEATTLSDHRVIPLAASALFPAAQAGTIYAFARNTPDATLDTMRQQARALSDLLGPGGGAAAAPVVAPWVVSDPAHAEFAQEVPAAAVDDERNFVARDQVALVKIDGAWTTAERVAPTALEGWKLRKASGPGRDPRLLPDTRNSQGHREVTFDVALDQMRVRPLPPGWPFTGPRVAHEFLAGLRTAGFAPMLYAESWERTSGVKLTSAAAREHRTLLEAVRLGLSFDQVDLPATALGEFLLRRLVQVETAVRRAPLSPDYSGLEHMLSTSVDSTGAVVPPEFHKWSVGIIRDDAQVLKQNRLWREEQGHQAKKGKGKGKDKKGKEKGQGGEHAADDA